MRTDGNGQGRPETDGVQHACSRHATNISTTRTHQSESRATDMQQTHVQCTSNNRYTCVARTLNVGINIGTAQAQGPRPPSAGAQRRCSPTRRNTQACSRLSARCHSRGVRNPSGRTEANGDRRRETIRGADGRGPTERDKGKAHHSSAPAVERALSQPWCSENPTLLGKRNLFPEPNSFGQGRGASSQSQTLLGKTSEPPPRAKLFWARPRNLLPEPNPFGQDRGTSSQSQTLLGRAAEPAPRAKLF